EPLIAQQGNNRIIIQLPGVKDPQRIVDLLGKTAKLTFHLVDENISPQDLQAGRAPPGDMLLPSDRGPGMLAVKTRSVVTGENLTKASASLHPNGIGYIVNFSFDGIGTRKFGQVTTENVGKRFAVVLDGKIITAPSINTPILGGSGYIEGNFTPETA